MFDGMRGMFDFNPRSPCGERPYPPPSALSATDFNPRSPCGERHGQPGGWERSAGISIHAPRVGSDGPPVLRHLPPSEISIHAPRVGSDYLHK